MSGLDINKLSAAAQPVTTTGPAQTNALTPEQAQAFLAMLEQTMGTNPPAWSPALASTLSGPAAAPGTAAQNLSVQTAQWMAMYALENLPLPGMDSSQSSGSMDPLSMTSLTTGMGLNSSPLSTLEQALSLSSALGASPVPSFLPSQSVSAPAASGSNGSLTGAIDSAIAQASAQYGVAPALIRAIITQESGGNPNAVSSAGAQGLMQLMPGTAAELGVTDPFNPVQNIMGGTQYLAQLLQTFSGNTQLAVAAYNAGPGAVQSYGGIPPYAETQQYVRNVMALMGSQSTGQASV